MNHEIKVTIPVREYIKARTHGKVIPVRKGRDNAGRAGMSIKDYIRAKAKGEL